MCPYPSCTRIGQLGTVLSTIVLLVWAVVSVSLVKYRSNSRNCLIRPRGANVVNFGDLGQFGALTAEQQAMVNAFAEMVRRGQVPVPSGEPSHTKGDLPLEEGDKRDSTQIDDSRERLGDDMETESLRVELQQSAALAEALFS